MNSNLRLCIVSLLGICLSTAPLSAEDWPRFRGAKNDGISQEKGLLTEWPEAGPKVAWQIDNVGVGYSSLAIVDGKIYTQGDLNGVEHIICIDAKDGRRLWAVQPAGVSEDLAKKMAEEITKVDTNKSGLIEEAEALARFGWDFNKFDHPVEGDAAEIAAKRATALLKILDADKDGKLSFTEAGRSMSKDFSKIDRQDRDADAGKIAAARSAALFATLDKDKDGKLAREEVRRSALERRFKDIDAKESDGKLSASEVTTYLSKREAGRDGLVSRDELLRYYASRNVRGDGILTKEELKGYYGGYRNGMGNGPRGTPTIDGERVYTIGGNGDVTCLEATTGKTIWHVRLSDDLGGGRPGWGYSESPLVEGNLLIVTPGGGGGTLAALNKLTGKVVWRCEETKQGAHYSSAVAADIGGVRQVVQFARESLFGVDATNGKLLWSYKGANNGTANISSPVIEGDNVFAASAYSTGGGLATISTTPDGQQAKEAYFENKMQNHHGGMVKVGEHLYGFGSGGLICMNFKTGKIAWQARSVSKGSLVVADGMLYLLGEKHEVALAEVTPEEYRETGRFPIESQGRPSWAHPVVSGGRLYIRNQHSLTAYDIRK